MPPPSPQPPRKQHSEAEVIWILDYSIDQFKTQQKQHPKPPAVNVMKPAVEINNSPPSSYTNGKLNPDRAAADNVSSEDISESSSEPNRETGTPSSNQVNTFYFLCECNKVWITQNNPFTFTCFVCSKLLYVVYYKNAHLAQTKT